MSDSARKREKARRGDKQTQRETEGKRGGWRDCLSYRYIERDRDRVERTRETERTERESETAREREVERERFVARAIPEQFSRVRLD